jgi:hypothetical protein
VAASLAGLMAWTLKENGSPSLETPWPKALEGCFHERGCGIIGAPNRLPLTQLDTKLSAFLKGLTPKSVFGKDEG